VFRRGSGVSRFTFSHEGRLPVVSTDADLVRRAITTSRRWQLAVWDGLIVEAARSSGCDRILSEDLQNGQDFDGVKVVNPF
jgi:predicted nucleic acid-binding protein